MTDSRSAYEFPRGLANWAGHRSGGVRRMFDDGSGRPSGEVVKTRLLELLEQWANDLVAQVPNTPKILLLVGGPGNGKTEAVEAVIGQIYQLLGPDGLLDNALQNALSSAAGQAVPRMAIATLKLSDDRSLSLHVVQDASVSDGSRPDANAPELLLQELELFANPQNGVYLACVNRGVLDDALILATEQARNTSRTLLESITRAVSLTPDAPQCWPLEGFSEVAIWPMDAESLLVSSSADQPSPAARILAKAAEAERWPPFGTCAAGVRCPFCHSRKILSSASAGNALLNILRFYELGCSKRWTFRDLFSLFPQLLAYTPATPMSPCEWAAHCIELDKKVSSGVDKERASALYFLVGAGYQHVLFGEWERDAARALFVDLKEMKLQQDPTLLGLYHFLRSSKLASAPTTVRSLLIGLSNLLDPAMASPESLVQLSTTKTIVLADIDVRFSRSVAAGLEYLLQNRCLSPMERGLIGAAYGY